MEQDLQSIIDGNAILKKYFEYPKEELEVMRMLINLELIYIQRNEEQFLKARIIKTCFNESYNYLDYILSFILYALLIGIKVSLIL